ncbi:hypothetical protein BT96DRAFT_996801 [Gymnopus androsaceus JB14]|uniref:Uncharacterized protein n=1 Tax=Gymnopus androsaceus JB14 TaxID=1447944 RepID=A0A6A4HF34_9AGAR|nr:hypothetical protein BT96DRAFT_996801 [Gymnopus androsaceus JB14]
MEDGSESENKEDVVVEEGGGTEVDPEDKGDGKDRVDREDEVDGEGKFNEEDKVDEENSGAAIWMGLTPQTILSL